MGEIPDDEKRLVLQKLRAFEIKPGNEKVLRKEARAFWEEAFSSSPSLHSGREFGLLGLSIFRLLRKPWLCAAAALLIFFRVYWADENTSPRPQQSVPENTVSQRLNLDAFSYRGLSDDGTFGILFDGGQARQLREGDALQGHRIRAVTQNLLVLESAEGCNLVLQAETREELPKENP